jgi:putative hydrolase of the HAD superfamily
MIKAIIFDLDNTLMDFMKMKNAAVEAAADSMIDAGLDMPKKEILEEIFKVYWKEGIEDQQVFDKVLEKKFGKIDYKILAAGILGYRRAKDASMVIYPHVRLALTSLARMGLKMAVISDAPKLPVWMRIIGLGLEHYFDFVITPEDTGEKKPSPKPFRLATKLLGVNSGEILMVGDWVERDIVGAKSSGIRTVFAKYGNTFGTEISGADFEVNDIIELVNIVKKDREVPE